MAEIFLIEGACFRGGATAYGLLVNGGHGLGSTLVQLGLVDEYHFLVQPIVAGRGPQLLGGIRDRLDLKLTGTKHFDSGAVLLRYTPVR